MSRGAHVGASRVLRVLLASGIVAFLVWRAGPAGVRAVLGEAWLPAALLAAVAMVIEACVKAWNWRRLVCAMLRGACHPWRGFARCYFAAGFFGTLMPSSASTDVLRTVLAQRAFGGHVAGHAGALVVLNLLHWLAGSVIGLAGVAMLLSRDEFPTTLRAAGVLLLAVALGVPTTLLLLRRRRDLLVLPLRRLPRRAFRVRHAARRFLDALLLAERAHVGVLPLVGVAVLAIGLQPVQLALDAVALGIHVPAALWLVLPPLVALAGLLPVSVSGFGAPQALYVYVLGLFGVAPHAAFALSALLAVQVLLVNALVGGLVVASGTDSVARIAAREGGVRGQARLSLPASPALSPPCPDAPQPMTRTRDRASRRSSRQT